MNNIRGCNSFRPGEILRSLRRLSMASVFCLLFTALPLPAYAQSTDTPTQTDSSIAPATSPTAAPLPGSTRIGPLTFISQTLNNCGPASVAEVLSYCGIQRTQAQVAQILRPDLPLYGMSLYGVPFYAESVGMRAFESIGGTDLVLKALVANGFPVIVSDLVSRSENIRHFRPIDGYDDAGGYFIGSDPYLGPNHKIGYGDFDDLWNISNRRFVVIYPPDKQAVIDGILRDYWSRDQALQNGMQFALQRAGTQPRLPWVYYEMADLQIDLGDLNSAQQNIQKGSVLGFAFEGHWLQLKLQRASGNSG